MEDIIDIIVTETTNLIEITSQPTDEIIDVNIIDNREDVTLNVTPTLVEININSLTGNFGVNWGEIAGTLSNQTDLQNALNLKADLVDGKVPSSQLPSYVDDVVEVANYAALPVTGEVGKIYITLDTNYIYRWTGSTYVEIKDSSAVWGAITGTLSNQTDLQNALNAKLNLTGGTLSGALTLGSSSGDNQTLLNLPASNKLIYREGVGSLYGFNIESGVDNSLFLTNTEGGYYQTLYFGDSQGGYNIFGISTSSNSGSTWNPRFVINQNGNIGLNKNNPSEILDVAGNGLFSGNVTANTFVKSGGTSSQFLKADGSVDSNTYLTTSSAASTYVPYIGASGAVNLGAYDLTVNSIKVGKGAGNVFDNTRVGDAALNSNTSGGSNTAIGYNALLPNTIGGGNTSIGAYSLLNNVSGANNTAIGYNAGQSITTGSNNVIIGGYAGTSALASNVVLSDGGGNIRFQFDGTNTFIGQTGNLLIGVSLNAGYKLDVNGTARISGALSGTTATFSGDITIGAIGNSSSAYHRGSFNGANTSANLSAVYFSGGESTQNRAGLKVYQTWGGTYTDTCVDLFVTKGGVGGTTALSINGLGAATFSGTLSAGQSTFTHADTPVKLNNSGGTYTQLDFLNNGTQKAAIWWNNSTSTLNFWNGTYTPLIIASSGAATFSSSVISNIGLTGTKSTFATYDASGYGAGLGYVSGSYGFISSQSGSSPLALSIDGSPKLWVAASGNVGIGTTSPMTFGSFTNLTIASSATNNYSAIFLVNSSVSIRGSWYQNGGNQINFGTATAHPLVFDTSDVERMRITSGGSVLVGTTSSLGFAMEVNGSIWAQKLRINDTASGYVTLEMENSSRWRINYLGRFSGYGAGTLTTDASGNISASSDRTLKDVIKPIENVLENIKDFEPVYFKWNDKTDLDKENVYMSTIAQSIQKHYPDAVGKMADGTLTVQDRAVTAILVQAIKELTEKVKTLENK